MEPKLREHIALQTLRRISAIVGKLPHDALEGGNATTVGACELREELSCCVHNAAACQLIDDA